MSSKGTKAWEQRSEERAWVMRFLYAMNILNEYDSSLLSGWYENFEVPDEYHEFITKSIESTLSNLSQIDAMIIRYIKGWDYSRIPKIDKAILRLATNEILFDTSIPVGATIDEAVKLSKTYSNENSFRFLNGILGNIVKEDSSL